MRYFMELAYDGTSYHGWQVQTGATSLQELIEKGLRYKAGFTGRITGCGRTDAGVHARQFFAHFDFDELLSEEALGRLAGDLNRYFPDDVVIFRIFRVKDEAHSRYDALSRTYEYNIALRPDPFNRFYTWHLHFKPDFEKMNLASAILMEYTDFTSFSKLHSDAITNICHVTQAEWKEDDGLLVFRITADRFLRNMVRAVVGTIIDVGRGKTSLEDFRQIIESRNRQNAGFSVPARALFLQSVVYDWLKILPCS
ncbi:MAG TPA: tRNA pseudouridine synthase A [Bacteroidales bacterium]|nr:tRNA pseudouridine synthase A [Bacteroidales bacterium]HRW97423.1 tRNA pseudouridine synthase A [Bacteroidales bacterium]